MRHYFQSIHEDRQLEELREAGELFGKTKLRGMLYEAAAQGHLAVVQRLIEMGVNTKAKVDEGATALIAAAQNGHTEVVSALLNAGADIYEKADDGKNALLAALQRSRVSPSTFEVVKVLLASGAEVECGCEEGSALAMAAKCGYELTKLLLGYGADVNGGSNGSSALIEAVKSYEYAAADLLVSAGAEVNFRDSEGYTALLRLLASGTGNKDLIDVLSDRTEFSTDESANDGYTYLMGYANCGDAERVKALLSEGVNVDKLDKRGYNALVLAARCPSVECVKLLLEAGAYVDSKTGSFEEPYGKTALIAATEAGSAEVVKVLLEAGAYTKIRTFEGETALDIAQKQWRHDIEELLQETVE